MKLNRLQKSGPFWNALGSAMVSANSVILLMVVSHMETLETVGAFSIALTTSQILYTIALFGINDIQMTDYGHQYSFQDYSLAKLVSTVVACFVGAVCVAAFRFSGRKLSFVMLLTFFMMINSAGELFQSQFFQYRRLDLSGKALFFRYFLSTLAFVLVAVCFRNISAACWAMILVNLLATWFWDLRPLPDYRMEDPPWEPGRWFRLLKENLPLCLAVLGSQVVINSPKYMINMVSSDEVQGAFSLLFMPTMVINLLSIFIFKPALPQYDEALRSDRCMFNRLLKKQLTAIGLICLACAAGMLLLGRWALRLLFGVDLGLYRAEMSLFMLAGGVMAANQLLYFILVILRRQRLVLLTYVSGLIAAVAVGIPMIRRFEIAGALVSYAMSQLTVLLVFSLIIRYELRRRNP